MIGSVIGHYQISAHLGSGDGAIFQAGTPTPLFEGRYVPGTRFTNYDVSVDGRRFLMLKPGPAPPPMTQFRVVLNAFNLLKPRGT